LVTLSNKKLEEVKISNVSAFNKKLEVKLTFSKKISRYFSKNNFTIYYDENIENVDESILSIPAVLAILPICWATGAELYVKKLDKTCLLSLLSLRKVFKEKFANFSSDGNINVQQTIVNKFNNNQTALFFSGGVDSSSSYLEHKHEQPILFTLINTERSFDNKTNQLRNWYKKFAEQKGLELHIIRSNLLRPDDGIIKNDLLTHEFKIPHGWWGGVGYALITLGLCAPLTIEKIGKIFLASTPTSDVFEGGNFLRVHNFSWADINIVYDGENMERQEKIFKILNTDSQFLNHLRCCYGSDYTIESKNCGYCEKCMRTIVGLILAGIDPNECNFEIKNNMLSFIKQMYISNLNKFLFESKHDWQIIQKNISARIKNEKLNSKYSSEKFFKWLESFDMKNYKVKTRGRKLRRIYYHLKYDGMKKYLPKIS